MRLMGMGMSNGSFFVNTGASFSPVSVKPVVMVSFIAYFSNPLLIAIIPRLHLLLTFNKNKILKLDERNYIYSPWSVLPLWRSPRLFRVANNSLCDFSAYNTACHGE
jgi:hypothetical protein